MAPRNVEGNKYYTAATRLVKDDRVSIADAARLSLASNDGVRVFLVCHYSPMTPNIV